MYNQNAYIRDGVFQLLGEHAIHWRNNLYGHVDNTLAEDETDSCFGRGWIKEGLQSGLKLRDRCCF